MLFRVSKEVCFSGKFETCFMSFFLFVFFFLQAAIVESHKKEDSEGNNDNFFVTGPDNSLNH